MGVEGHRPALYAQFHVWITGIDQCRGVRHAIHDLHSRSATNNRSRRPGLLKSAMTWVIQRYFHSWGLEISQYHDSRHRKPLSGISITQVGDNMSHTWPDLCLVMGDRSVL